MPNISKNRSRSNKLNVLTLGVHPFLWGFLWNRGKSAADGYLKTAFWWLAFSTASKEAGI